MFFKSSDIHAELTRLKLARGDNIIVHSSVFPFFKLDGLKPMDIPVILYNILRSIIGNEGTIIVPTFNFSFCDGVHYDPITTKSHNMGGFAEYIRLLPNAQRSKHPMQSVAAIGPLADYICAPDTQTSFGIDSSFDRILKINAIGLLLGISIKSFSLIHLAEEQIGVPYRYFKRFSGTYGPNNLNKTYSMYVRDEKLNPQIKIEKIAKILQQEGFIKSSTIGNAEISLFKANNFISIAKRMLKQDKSFLII